MTCYVLMIHAEDGLHFTIHKTLAIAGHELARQMGYRVRDGIQADRRYRDGDGRTLVIEPRPDGWTVRREKMLNKAFDARETGTATAQQLAFLEQHHF